MNIKKQLTSISIISILCTGFLLAPSSALAEKHYSKEQQHSKSFSNQRFNNSRSHSKNYNRHYNRNNKHNSRYYDYEPRRHNRHYGHEHNSRRNHSINYVYPWFLAQPYFNDGHFSIRYQDDNIGFTFRD